jgi:tetratricopeptide (TPR) repeat protein
MRYIEWKIKNAKGFKFSGGLMKRTISVILVLLWISSLFAYSGDAERYLNSGLAKCQTSDYAGAIRDFNKAIELDPKLAGAYGGRGLAEYKLCDYKGAIRDLNKAIELNPKLAVSYHNRGNAKFKSGDYKGAIKDYDIHIALEPNDSIDYFNRGLSRSNLGDKKGALEDLKKARDLGYNKASDAIKKIKKSN